MAWYLVKHRDNLAFFFPQLHRLFSVDGKVIVNDVKVVKAYFKILSQNFA